MIDRYGNYFSLQSRAISLSSLSQMASNNSNTVHNRAFHDPHRWVVLAGFGGVAMVSQMLWLNFTPLLSDIQKRYQVSEMTALFSLVLVFPLLYVLFSIPAGILIDKKGYRFSVAWGGIIMAAFSLLRIIDTSFYCIVAGQVGVALAQPFIVNAIAKLASDWFSEEQGAMANGLGTVGMFLGMALGLILTPYLVDTLNFQMAMVVFAGISIAAAGFYIYADRSPPPVIHSASSASQWNGIGNLLKNKYLILLFFISFLGLGFFNGLMSLIEPLLAPRGFSSKEAGLAGSIMIFGGIGGAAVIPALSDHFRKRKPFFLLSVLFSLVALYPFGTINNYTAILVLSGAIGFFFLPAYALLLEMCSELAGETWTGSATGLLMLAGNAGGVVVPLSMEIVKGDSGSFYPALILLLALLGVAMVAALFLRETYGIENAKEL